MQLTIGLISVRLDPQTAVDIPHFCLVDSTHNGVVSLEEGVNDLIIENLEAMGHGTCDGIPS